MIQALKKLWRDRRGNALVIFGAALPLVVGSAGLATDTIQWALWKRQLQRSADSAALAGAYALSQEKNAVDAANRDIVVNSHLPTTPTKNIEPPPTSGPYAGDPTAVRVTLSMQRKLGFSGLFLASTPTITATATAKLVDQDKYCVVALKKSGKALEIGGSSNVVMGCGAISNSADPLDSVDVDGTAHYFEADPVAAAGGMPTSINGVTDLDPWASPLPDPFESKYSTDVPTGMSCTNTNHPSKSNADGSLKPGCYSSFNVGNGTTVLSPGVYYLNNASINLVGNELIIGEGVTIILTGSNPGTITMSGNSALQLTAPTDATCGLFNGTNSCLYKKMLLIQAANADPDNANTINGNNLTALDGALYFPKGSLTFSGDSAQSTKCAMVVGYTVAFNGNANIQNDMDPDDCDADQQASGKSVRLVA
ncbi:MAG TPA: Tad domain-containing protein [Sphingomicrobium sp.]|nr:Tad domain-containing protein [Sphingomicrobium sp.]